MFIEKYANTKYELQATLLWKEQTSEKEQNYLQTLAGVNFNAILVAQISNVAS